MSKQVILINSMTGGGAERVVSILLEYLNDSKNIELVLINKVVQYSIPNGIEVTYLFNSKLPPIINFILIPYFSFRFFLLCKQKKIDKSISFLYQSNFINVFAKFFGHKPKVIVCERNYPSDIFKYPSLKSYVNKFLIKKLYKLADVVIANSNKSANDLKINFNVPYVKTIYNPVNIDNINSLSIIEKISYEKLTFVSVASLTSQKNHIDIIDCLSKINKDYQYFIIGEGILEQQLKLYVKNLNLQDKIKFIGFKKNPFPYVRASDCLLLSSKYEGFPNVLLESLSLGTPFISYNCNSGPSEIFNMSSKKVEKFKSLRISENGILVDNQNKKAFLNALNYYMDNYNKFNVNKDWLEKLKPNKIAKKFNESF